jgi:lipopolysaccharide transport system ATP-binding protein
MSDTVIEIDNLSKKYRLGVLATGTLRHDFDRWWHRVRGKPDPYTKIGLVQKSEVTSDPSLADDEMWALKDVSLEIKQGEIVGIIGRNGAGKSTLLKILSRVTAPTSGEVRVKGRIASLLEVGTGFHPELTGCENVYLNGAILGMTKKEIDRRFDEIVAFAEIDKFIDTPVKRYSSGMYMRLAFAVAAHLEPEILIVDEVLAVGDAAFQKKCLGKLGDVAEAGRTVLFVSHSMSAIARLCDWALLVDHGRIVDQGNTQNVIEKYLSQENGKTCHVKLPPDASRKMRLREITVLNSHGIPSSQVEMAKPFRVRVSYDVNRKLESAYVICYFLTPDGSTIFGTGDSDCNPERLGMREPGHYSADFEVPAFLLGEGHYTIGINLAIPFGEIFDRHPNVVSFEVVDLRSGSHHGVLRRRPGILAVRLSWRYAKCETVALRATEDFR